MNKMEIFKVTVVILKVFFYLQNLQFDEMQEAYGQLLTEGNVQL